MIMQSYLIFDSKSQMYNHPFFLLNDQIALRSAQDIMADPNSSIKAHPADYTMFNVGTYDDTTGVYTQSPTQTVICRFHEIQGEFSLPLTAGGAAAYEQQLQEVK